MRHPLTHWRKSLPVAVQTRPTTLLGMPEAFDKFIEDFYQEAFNTPTSFGDWEKLMISPSVDLLEDDKQLKIEIEMPGMGPEDVKLSIADHVLTIKGEKTTSKTDKDQNYMKREIAYGAYQRTIPLPNSVDTTQAKASFKKGMLWVTLPKKAEVAEQFKEIKVEQA